MSVSICIQGYSGKESLEFQKHYKAVQFCLENGLSFPRETSEFFKGKVGGGDLEDYTSEAMLEYIENGVEVDIPTDDVDGYGNEYHINVADIPSEVDTIIIKYC